MLDKFITIDTMQMSQRNNDICMLQKQYDAYWYAVQVSDTTMMTKVQMPGQ